MRSSAAIAIGFPAPLLATLRSLEPTCEVLAAEEPVAALSMLRGLKVNALFVASRFIEAAPREFTQLRNAAPDVPTAVVGPPPSGELLARLADDAALSFLSLDQPTFAFSLAARRLLLPRGDGRLSLQTGEYRVTGRIDGHLFEHPLRDLSNRGLSFSIPLGASLIGFVPGVVITDLVIRDQGHQPLLGPVNATIRHSQSDEGNAEAPWYVGLSFDSQTNLVSPHKRLIKNAVPIHASLRKAVQGGAQFTVELPDDEAGFRFQDAVVRSTPEPHLVLLGDVRGQLRQHDAVRLTFSHHGQSYVGMTSVIAAEEDTALAIPRTLRVYHRRVSPRIRPTPDRPYRVHLRSKLTGCDDTFGVYDLNATGASIEIDAASAVLPPGLILDVGLTLPDGREPLQLRGVVRTLRALPMSLDRGELSLMKCGLELTGFTEEGHRRLCDSLLIDGFPHVETSKPQDFDAVRQMIKDAKFGVQLYGEDTPRNMAILRRSFERLDGPGRKVGMNLLYRRNNALQGQISGIRIFSRTWLATHLVTLHQGLQGGVDRASRALTLGVGEYLEHEPTADFIKMLWDHDRRFADRMFGWVGRMIHQPGLSDGRAFDVYVRPWEAGPVPMPAGVEVTDTTPEHLALIERFFARTVNVVRIWAEELTVDGLKLRELNATYAAAGLERRRDVHMAFVDGAPAGFSLLEYTTPGMQMSDLASGFDVFVFPEVPEAERGRVREALVADAVAHYRGLGAPFTVATTELTDESLFTRAGFELKCHMRTRFFHMSLYRSWAEFSELVFRGVQERAERRAKRRNRHDVVHSGGEPGRDAPPDQPGSA